MTQIPSDDILESVYKFRVRESEKLRTVLEVYNMEIHQKKAGHDYQRLKTMVKRSNEQDLRNRNFAARNGNYERNAVVKNQGTKQRGQRILGDCWQWEANGQCSKGQDCSFRHDVNKRAKLTQPNPSPSSVMQQDGRKASRTQSPRGKSPSGRVPRWPCKDYLKGTCTNSSMASDSMGDKFAVPLPPIAEVRGGPRATTRLCGGLLDLSCELTSLNALDPFPPPR